LKTPGEASRLFFIRLPAALLRSPRALLQFTVPLLVGVAAPLLGMNKKEQNDYAEKRRQLNAEAARERIKTDALLDVLQNYALEIGQEYEYRDKAGKKRKTNNIPKMNNTKLKAIEILLDKSVPNLAAVKHDVEVSNMTFVINTDYAKE
jgi:hypothetical protein